MHLPKNLGNHKNLVNNQWKPAAIDNVTEKFAIFHFLELYGIFQENWAHIYASVFLVGPWSGAPEAIEFITN